MKVKIHNGTQLVKWYHSTKANKIAENSTEPYVNNNTYNLTSVNARKVLEIRLCMLDITVNFKEKYNYNIACFMYCSSRSCQNSEIL